MYNFHIVGLEQERTISRARRVQQNGENRKTKFAARCKFSQVGE